MSHLHVTLCFADRFYPAIVQTTVRHKKMTGDEIIAYIYFDVELKCLKPIFFCTPLLLKSSITLLSIPMNSKELCFFALRIKLNSFQQNVGNSRTTS